jgi:iron-sulfur cluster repair protein YtfE (RIC family)
MTQDPDHLDLRTGLPDALRILLAEFPREGWEDNPHFEGLVRFWLERHMMFRRLTEALTEDAEKMLDRSLDPMTYGQRLSRLGAMLVGELHGHHHIEDAHYFPLLARTEPRLETGFALLDRDHQALDVHLSSFTDRANAVLGQIVEPSAHEEAGAFHEGVVGFTRFLDRHLVDEEELVVPVILKHAPDGLM